VRGHDYYDDSPPLHAQIGSRNSLRFYKFYFPFSSPSPAIASPRSGRTFHDRPKNSPKRDSRPAFLLIGRRIINLSTSQPLNSPLSLYLSPRTQHSLSLRSLRVSTLPLLSSIARSARAPGQFSAARAPHRKASASP
jgi:hypothetical protein